MILLMKGGLLVVNGVNKMLCVWCGVGFCLRKNGRLLRSLPVKRDLANWESVSHTFVVYYVNMAGGYVFVIILCIVIFASTSSYTVSSSQFKRGR